MKNTINIERQLNTDINNVRDDLRKTATVVNTGNTRMAWALLDLYNVLDDVTIDCLCRNLSPRQSQFTFNFDGLHVSVSFTSKNDYIQKTGVSLGNLF